MEVKLKIQRDKSIHNIIDAPKIYRFVVMLIFTYYQLGTEKSYERNCCMMKGQINMSRVNHI